MSPSPFPLHPVLIVEDEPEILKSFQVALRSAGINHVIPLPDSRNVLSFLKERSVGVVLLDLLMPHVPGMKLLPEIRREFPEIPVIIVTGIDKVGTAVECMKAGAFDYVVKPVEISRLLSAVRHAVELWELKNENLLLKEHMLSGKLHHAEVFKGILTRNRTMHSIFQYLESIARSTHPILITGETGVGKELLVRAAHALSPLKGPLVSVNVAGIDDNAFSDTLFGHVRGAFTSASERRRGLVEQASKGTIHLDEIGDLSSESQVKLLRLLEEKEYFPLGSDTAKTADIRVIVTTNRGLLEHQESGRFRRDLYYRLCTHHIHIPPLRERLDDLPLLLDHFLKLASRALRKDPPACPEAVIGALARYSFPGNVRELKAMVSDAVTRNKTGRLAPDDFVGLASASPANGSVNRPRQRSGDERPWHRKADDTLPTLEEATRLLVAEALSQFNNNQSLAARALGISRQRLARCVKGRKG